jgi:hypothetical protein
MNRFLGDCQKESPCEKNVSGEPFNKLSGMILLENFRSTPSYVMRRLRVRMIPFVPLHC